MSKEKKEPTVKEADEKASKVKSKEECAKCVVEEAMKLYQKKSHDIQQMYAYCREMENYDKAAQKKK